jgi:hypothetical protein
MELTYNYREAIDKILDRSNLSSQERENLLSIREWSDQEHETRMMEGIDELTDVEFFDFLCRTEELNAEAAKDSPGISKFLNEITRLRKEMVTGEIS